jgi:hypothetical protein
MTGLTRAALALALPVATFGLGYGWMYMRHRSYQQGAEATQQRLMTTERELRLARLQLQLAAVLMEVERKNYGNARDASSKFFDELRSVAGSAENPQQKSRLEAVLAKRDEVTAAITEMKPEAADLLRKLYADLDGRQEVDLDRR